MWKLLDPRSTAARTSGTGRGALRGVARLSGDRAVAVTCGTRGPGDSGGRKRGSAAAGRHCVRIADDELRAFESFAVIDLGAGEVLHAHRVDEQLHPEILDTGVTFLDGLIELEAVLQAGASTALDEHAQHELRVALPKDQVADLAGGGIGEFECRGLLQRFGRSHGIHMRNESKRQLWSGQSGPSHPRK